MKRNRSKSPTIVFGTSPNEHWRQVQTLNTFVPITGEIVDMYKNLVTIADDDAETTDDLLSFHRFGGHTMRFKDTHGNPTLISFGDKRVNK